jgi:hypothetical protein
MAKDIIFGKTGRDFGIPDTSGSILLPEKQQKALMAKVDDVRYDLRRVGGRVGAGLLSLAAALGVLGIASIYRTASEDRKLR